MFVLPFCFMVRCLAGVVQSLSLVMWVFTVTASSECHGVVDVVVMVVMMCSVVWMDSRGFFGLGFGVGMLCGRELFKEEVGFVVVVGVLREEVGPCWGVFL